MTLDEGALFLLRRAKIIAPNATLEALPAPLLNDARTICQLVDGLPLALDQAGAIEETKTSVSGYTTLYQKHEKTLLKQRRKFATGHPQSLATTLALCLAQAQQQNAAALELLTACAFLQPDAIPGEFFSKGASELGPTFQDLLADELAWNAALETLLDLSLLRRNSDTETISINRLVQVVLRNEMKEDIQRLWAERSIKALCRLFPEPELGVWQQCQQYLPHVLIAADLIKQWSFSFAEAAQLLSLAGSYLSTIARYNDARKLCELALSIDEQVHGEEHPETARTLQRLGTIDANLGDYPQAQQRYERALAIGERTWGSDHPDTANLLNDLGELFQAATRSSRGITFARIVNNSLSDQ